MIPVLKAQDTQKRAIPLLIRQILETHLQHSKMPWLIKVFSDRPFDPLSLEKLMSETTSVAIEEFFRNLKLKYIDDLGSYEYWDKTSYQSAQEFILQSHHHEVAESIDSIWNSYWERLTPNKKEYFSFYIVQQVIEAFDAPGHPSHQDWTKIPYFQISDQFNLFYFENQKRQYKSLYSFSSDVLFANTEYLLNIKKQAIAFIKVLFRTDIVRSQNFYLRSLFIDKFKSYTDKLTPLENIYLILFIKRELKKILTPEELLNPKLFAVKNNSNTKFYQENPNLPQENKQYPIKTIEESELEFLFQLIEFYESLDLDKPNLEQNEIKKFFETDIKFINHSNDDSGFSPNKKVLLEFICLEFTRLIETTDFLLSDERVKKFIDKLSKAGIFKNREAKLYFLDEYLGCIENFINRNNELDINNDLSMIPWYKNPMMTKLQFIYHLNQLKTVIVSKIPLKDRQIDESHKSPKKILKKIDMKGLQKSRLFQYGHLVHLNEDIFNEKYEIYSFKIMKDIGDIIHNTDIMMPQNKEIRFRFFEELKSFYVNIGVVSQKYGRPNEDWRRLKNIIYTKLINYLDIDPRVSYYMKPQRNDDVMSNLQIYAEMYSHYFREYYPKIEIKGSYKPQDYGNTYTYIPQQLKEYNENDFFQLAARIHELKKMSEIRKNSSPDETVDDTEITKQEMQDLADELHWFLINTTLLQHMNTIASIIKLTINTLSSKSFKLLKQSIFINVLKVYKERGYLSEESFEYAIQSPERKFYKSIEFYKDLVTQKLVETIPIEGL